LTNLQKAIQREIQKSLIHTERDPKKPNSRDFAKTGLRETIQHHMPNPGQTYFDYYRYYTQKRDRKFDYYRHDAQKRDRKLAIEIRIKDGVTEAKEKILNAIKAAFQGDSAIENLDFKSVKVRKDFKKTLRAVRKSHLLTQAEMAERLGFSRDYISRLEGGHLKPGLRFLKKLVEEFGLSNEDVCRKV